MSSSLIGDDEVVIGVVGGGAGAGVEGHLVCFAFQSPMDGWMGVLDDVVVVSILSRLELFELLGVFLKQKAFRGFCVFGW